MSPYFIYVYLFEGVESVLIENMPNLRTLKVKFDESQDKNETLQWLQHRLSKTIYVSLVSNLMNKMATIQIWIR